MGSHVSSSSVRLRSPSSPHIQTELKFHTVIVYHRHALLDRLPSHVVDRLPERFTQRSHYAPLNTFDGQRAAGLSSAAFDLEANNIMAGDSRTGLDEVGVAEVRAIMQSRRVK